MQRKESRKARPRDSGNGGRAVPDCGLRIQRAAPASGARTAASGGSQKKTTAFLGMAADYARAIANGEAPPKIAAKHDGGRKKIAGRPNAIIDLINSRSTDIQALMTAAAEGRLDTGAGAAKYDGDHARLEDSVSGVRACVIGESRRDAGQAGSRHPEDGGLIQEITAASKEQDTGSEQINKALQQLEKVIRQNALAAEEMASTTGALTGQSGQAYECARVFRRRDTPAMLRQVERRRPSRLHREQAAGSGGPWRSRRGPGRKVALKMR